jgi:hypothetical protein
MFFKDKVIYKIFMNDKLRVNQVPFYKISRSMKDMEGLFKVNCTHFRNFFFFGYLGIFSQGITILIWKLLKFKLSGPLNTFVFPNSL